jgi:hypothetical protein
VEFDFGGCLTPASDFSLDEWRLSSARHLTPYPNFSFICTKHGASWALRGQINCCVFLFKSQNVTEGTKAFLGIVSSASRYSLFDGKGLWKNNLTSSKVAVTRYVKSFLLFIGATTCLFEAKRKSSLLFWYQFLINRKYSSSCLANKGLSQAARLLD